MECYLEIVLAVIVCTILFFLLSSKNWPLIRIIPTAYFQNHKLYNKLTQVLAENKGTILLKTSLFTSTDILVTSDPANVQHVMNSNYSTYQRGSEFRKAFDFLGGAAFIKDLDEWRQEKKFTHAFYKEIEFHKSTPKITHHTLQKGLIPVLDQASKHKHVLDLQVLFNRYMLDATCLLATGFDLGSLLVGSPLLDAMDDISEAVFYRHVLPERVWKMQRWLRIGKEKKFGEAVNVLNRILDDYVSKKYEIEETTSRGTFDVLRFYLANINKSTKQDEKSYLCFNIMTLLFAGRDTSAALLTWFFYVVSENPLVEKNILQEISETISPKANLLSSPYLFYDVDELSKLVYLHGALTECLRLFPTAPVIIRDPIEEDVLPSGHRVDRKTKVVLCTYAMGRMPEIWGEDCEEFKPERWISEKGEIKRVASNNFLAFGSGPWACPGKEVAFARMKGVVATVMYNYRVQVVEGQSNSLSDSALLNMRHGLKAVISKRCV